MLSPVRLSINLSHDTPIVSCLFLRWHVHKHFFLIVFIAFISFSDVTKAKEFYAKENSEKSSVEQLPTVTVTASRIAADDIDTNFQTSSVTVIYHEEFDTKVATVADVLRKESGVQIRQTGGLGSSSRVNIRGSSAKQVNVYLDGVLLNGAFGGSVDLSQFTLGNVEQIEIYRGNAPVQLGYSGIGGAINIKTRKLGGKPLKQLVVGVGSFGSKKVAASIADSYQGNDFFLAGEYLAADNDFDIVNKNGTPDYSGDDKVEKRNNAGFDHKSGLLSWSRDLGDAFKVKLLTQYFEKNDHLADTLNSEINKAELETDFYSGQLKLDYFYSSDITFGFKLFSSEKVEHYQDIENKVGLLKNNEEGKTFSYGGGVQSNYILEDNLISFNLETSVERYKQKDFIRHSTAEYERSQSILGLQNEWLSPQGDWLVNIGGRIFHVVDEDKTEHATDTEWHTGIHLGVLYSINDSIQLRGNISHNIRIPQLFELYGDRGFFEGNDELVPETAINIDTGIRYTSHQTTISTSIFYRDLDEAIVNNFNSRGVGKAENIAEAKLIGFELDASYQLTMPWTISLKSTIQDSTNINDDDNYDGNELAGLYSFSSFIDTTYVLNSMIYTLEYRHQSGGFYDSSNDAVIADQNIVNLSTKWQTSDQSIEVRVDNLGDKYVEDFHRYPMPGRHIFLVYKQSF
ncbi:MAG: iron complex outermembrane receptor protein [Pseudohongiellaceae bacterium]|jgi:iron complex outermembrane receptor protein